MKTTIKSTTATAKSTVAAKPSKTNRMAKKVTMSAKRATKAPTSKSSKPKTKNAKEMSNNTASLAEGQKLMETLDRAMMVADVRHLRIENRAKKFNEKERKAFELGLRSVDAIVIDMHRALGSEVGKESKKIVNDYRKLCKEYGIDWSSKVSKEEKHQILAAELEFQKSNCSGNCNDCPNNGSTSCRSSQSSQGSQHHIID